MIVLVPIAGFGKRFSEDGYVMPKPLISVLGEPMINHVLRSLRVTVRDHVYVVYAQRLDNFQFSPIVRKSFYGIDLHLLPLNFDTRGAAETVLCGLNKASNLEESVLVVDCDTFYREDIVAMAKKFDGQNGIFFFNDESDEPIFSYISISEDQRRVERIKEKVKISDHACVGAYLFKSGLVLKEYCELILNSNLKSNNEYYMSNVYAQMLENGEEIVPIQVRDFVCLGTPQQLKAYCQGNNKSSLRFCFDLDGTLVTFPGISGDYSTVLPITKNIKMVRYLHSLGHTIIIQTSRKMLTTSHNQGAATKLAYKEVFSSLERFDIPFDEIFFGKPFANFYIDDLTVKPFDIEREIGFYNTNVDARRFNNVRYLKDSVIKTTNNLGEIYWYKNIPTPIRDLFPRFTFVGNEIMLERIDGIVFSYLLINGSLTNKNIDSLLTSVNRIHALSLPVDINVDYRVNYGPKMKERYDGFDYGSVSNESQWIFDEILERIKDHIPLVKVIHGDLVFSNIFLCENQKIKFIDMRGRIGDVETILGDVFYDYAKIYQSLLGYDFIHSDCEINETYLSGLRSYYEKKFSEKHLKIIRAITACLLFSLIPLHDDLYKQKKYFSLIKRCL